jgi:hypothetical protein
MIAPQAPVCAARSHVKRASKMKEKIHGITPVQRRPGLGNGDGAKAAQALFAASVAGDVSYHHGKLLQNVRTIGAFIGAAWNTDPDAAAMRLKLDEFLAFLVTSDVIDNLAEYSINGMTIGHGRHAGSVVLDQIAVGATLDDSAIQTALTDAIAAGTLEPNDANTLYIAFTPDGTTVTSTIGTSCENLCGFHGELANNAAYAVIPFPSCPGCQLNGSVFDGYTSVVSHEVAEAITNPFDDGWHAADHSEIGDLCAIPEWKTRTTGGFVVQTEFSQANKDCR